MQITTLDEATGLLEREQELATLTELLSGAAAGAGRLVLVHGEAGIGKTALLRDFCDAAGARARVLWGTCDALFTPRPLDPLHDMAPAVGGPLAAALTGDTTPHAVASALDRELTGRRPTVVVFEDMHLADEATLDVLRLLGRRISDRRALLVVTYRDDELGRFHPLRLVLAEAAADSPPTRIGLVRLSPEAVATLAAPRGRHGGALYDVTLGNPFFVREALAATDADVPQTIRDAVLGRASGLSAGARRLLDAIAITPPVCERWLLEQLAADDIEHLDELVASGIVVDHVDGLAFRHELARRAVDDSMPVGRREVLHREALARLGEPPHGDSDPARLAHHAGALGDGAAVVKHAPRAAAHASRSGAHREAAAHYRSALRFADLVPVDARARLFEACAWEAYLVVAFDDAVAAQRRAVACYEELGDLRAQGTTLTFLAQLLWQSGSLPEGLTTIRQALELLEGEPSAGLAYAYCEMARLTLFSEDPAGASRWARRALAMTERLADPAANAMALQTVGWIELFSGDARGLEKLDRTIESATADGEPWLAVTACTIAVRTAGKHRDYGVADDYIEAGLEHCAVSDYDVYRYYLMGWQAMVLLARGDWARASEVALVCLADPCPFARVHALVALGLVRARRGDTSAWQLLDEAQALAEPRHEIQWTATVAIARAEAAWLEGRVDAVLAETEAACAMGTDGTWWSAGLAYWRWRAGAVDDPIPQVGEDGYRLEMAGDWAAAHAAWQATGSVYEAAFALLDADDEDSLRVALQTFRGLQAVPAAKLATARLREIGARGVPRGPRAATRDNPAQLTPRELEVLELLADGLRNAEIADRLVLSERTVDHHVSAILRKLGVANRVQAAAMATRIGIAPER